VDKLTVDFFDFCDKMLLYKMDQGVRITRMEEALVPHEHGMKVTSHREPISYGK
jgi:hypothetical protein